jgi:hypothetical protein
MIGQPVGQIGTHKQLITNTRIPHTVAIRILIQII